MRACPRETALSTTDTYSVLRIIRAYKRYLVHIYLQQLLVPAAALFSWASRGVTELLWNACLGTQCT